jgi:hypothetical protein
MTALLIFSCFTGTAYLSYRAGASKFDVVDAVLMAVLIGLWALLISITV